MVTPDVFNSNHFPLPPMRLSRDVFIQTMTLANRFAMETVYSKRKYFPMKTSFYWTNSGKSLPASFCLLLLASSEYTSDLLILVKSWQNGNNAIWLSEGIDGVVTILLTPIQFSQIYTSA